jgi:hypothetical protein
MKPSKMSSSIILLKILSRFFFKPVAFHSRYLTLPDQRLTSSYLLRAYRE